MTDDTKELEGRIDFNVDAIEQNVLFLEQEILEVDDIEELRQMFKNHLSNQHILLDIIRMLTTNWKEAAKAAILNGEALVDATIKEMALRRGVPEENIRYMMKERLKEQ